MPRSWLGRWVHKAGRHAIPAETPAEDTLRRHLAEAVVPVTDTLLTAISDVAERLHDPALDRDCWFCGASGGQPCVTKPGNKARREPHKDRGRP